MHKGFTISVLLGVLALYGCWRSDIADPPGWTCNNKRGYCTISSGSWEDIKIGMTNADALRAVCKATDRGVISTEEERHAAFSLGYTGSNPVEMKDGSCRPKTFELNQSEPLWSVQPRNIRCAMFVQRRQIWADFDTNGRLKKLIMFCPCPDF